MKIYTYSDNYGDEFDCEWLACGISGRYESQILIRDIESGDIGWCSAHLVDIE